MHLRGFTRSFALLAVVSISSVLGACGGSDAGSGVGDQAEETYTAATASLAIYGDALAAGWTDASSATRDLANTSPVATGARSISVTFGPSTTLDFHSAGGAPTAGFDAIELRVNGGANRNPQLRMAVRVAEVERPAVRLSDYCRIPRNGWRLCRVPLSALQATNQTLSGVVIQENAGLSLAPMYFDAISFVSTQPAQISTVAVAVSPTSSTLTTGGAQAFTATVTGTTNTAVTWSVQEGTAGGTVDASGRYTAPGAAGTYHVVATSQADTTKAATAAVTVAAPATTPPATTALPLYDDALAAGWTDSSWATRNLANTSPVASGTSSISVTFGPWTALHFHSTAGAPTAGLDAIELWVNGGTNTNPQLRVAVRVAEVERPAVRLSDHCGTIPTNAWKVCRVPLSALQATNETLSGVVVQENAGLSLAAMYLDAISLVSTQSSPTPPPTPTVAVAVSPTSSTLTTGGAQAFTATVTGTANTAVAWSVQEGAAGGTVDSSGRYTAPGAAGTYHVVAKSQADTTKAATATVTVTSPPPTSPPPTSPPPATASCGSEPLRTTGTTYYFCDCQAGAAAGCTAGDDNRTATQAQNPSTPWRSATKARSIFKTLQAGDTVALCRGGKFSYSGGSAYDLWRNRNCTAGSTCDFRDYSAPWGTGSEARPIVQVTDGGHFFYGVHSGGANASDAVQGFRFMNIELRAGPAYNGYAFNPAHYMSDLTVCNVVMDGFDIAIYQDNLVQRATYRGNRILNSAADGILSEGDTLVIDGNYFDNNGHNVSGGTQFQHTIYLGGASSKNIRVTNNEIHRSTMSGGSSGSGTCSGTMFVAHGGIDGLVIENNLLDAPNGGCWGLSLTGGGFPGYCYFRNTVIRRNRIVNVGNMSLGVENCPNCVIEDNVIVGGPDPSGITVPTSACTCTGGCDKTTGTIVRNNTIWFPGSVSWIAAINVKTEGTGHVVAGNAIQVASGSGISCLNLPLPPSSYAQVNNNVCYGASSWELSKGSLDAWRAATGFDSNSKQVDPGFVNPPTDFTPATTSPLLGAASPTQFSPSAVGSVSWSPGDVGKSRDSSPDAGAFER